MLLCTFKEESHLLLCVILEGEKINDRPAKRMVGKRNMEADKRSKRINERNEGLEIRKYLFILGLSDLTKDYIVYISNFVTFR